MTMILSDSQAALLSASGQSREIHHRYCHALEHLIKSESARAHLKQRCDDLDALSADLLELIDNEGLLPREADPEMDDLRELADQVRNWLDESRTRELLESFAREEAALADELEQIDAETLSGSIEKVKASIQALNDLSQQ